MNTEKKLLSFREAAQFLGVSLQTLRQWKSRGLVPHVRLGRRCLLRQVDLEKMIARGLQPAKWEMDEVNLEDQ